MFILMQFNLWIAVDHVKNQYRTWFHFSVKGFTKGTLLTFNIKNMQNQVNLRTLSPNCLTKAWCQSSGKRIARNGAGSPTRLTSRG